MKKALAIAALLVTAFAGSATAADKYDVKVNAPAAKAKAKGVAKISITPKGKYHMNTDYPAKLSLSGSDGLTVEKAKQTKADAAKFDQSAAEFQVSYTSASPGKKSITGELKFAVCADSECVPSTEKISIDVDVK